MRKILLAASLVAAMCLAAALPAQACSEGGRRWGDGNGFHGGGGFGGGFDLRRGRFHVNFGGGANFGEDGFHAGMSGVLGWGGAGLRASLDFDRGGFHGSLKFSRDEPAAGRSEAGAASIRNSWSYWGRWNGGWAWYGPEWYASNPGAWAAVGWVAATPWLVTPYGELVTLWGRGGASPVSYDYGKTIVHQGDEVYVNGQRAATAQQYRQQARELAAAGLSAPTANSDWKPLGVFGLAQPSDTNVTQIIQIAVNGQGILRGNYTNVVANTVLPIRGLVNTQTQRAAWTVGPNTSTVYEAGLHNLTQEQAPCLVHTGADSTRQLLLVRLQQPSQSQAGNGSS